MRGLIVVTAVSSANRAQVQDQNEEEAEPATVRAAEGQEEAKEESSLVSVSGPRPACSRRRHHRSQLHGLDDRRPRGCTKQMALGRTRLHRRRIYLRDQPPLITPL